ncbi:uncharacterized protein SPSK_06275 [Sporothrix schenckii 1099-18]|uniref:Heterokaryon incompatibility domain-containing protein n=1 Tax=Sporothrix schenckii 1099-18 TaxID=1397361 RepID=A0A0F2MKE4_SPOSC|nr:uncharacterized protein SPSK_06275 [Sporothrix schenckii 1099-18]KJR89310.1 hypothetical protein SPSK_06275 [Sporothrix schenckii 1099-18]
MSTFRYSPLQAGTDSIRLLMLNGGAFFSDISCQLFETSLAEAPGYSALSYTWENDEPTRGSESPHDISIDGHAVPVTSNLYAALQQIRPETGHIILWIDALCIDQSNELERGDQVRQMGQIFSTAEEVLIWLGPSLSDNDENGIQILFESINWIDGHATHAQTVGYTTSWATLCSDWMRQRPLDMLDTERIQRQAQKELLTRRWFTRVWILQEVAVAKTARVLCGSYACPARSFALMPSLIGLDVDERTQAILDIMPRFRQNTWWSSQRQLHVLLNKFANSAAKRPKDKIYALLGMSEDACDPERFYPHYTIPGSEAFRNTACFLLFGDVLDARHAFPDFTLEELRLPIFQLAQKTLEWALCQTEGWHEASHKTAARLVDRINEGQLERDDLLLSLARSHGQESDMDGVLSQGDIHVGVIFGYATNTLRVTSQAGPTFQANLVYGQSPKKRVSHLKFGMNLILFLVRIVTVVRGISRD